jgi:hypothetical protein
MIKLSSLVNTVRADTKGMGTIMDDDGRFFFSVGRRGDRGELRDRHPGHPGDDPTKLLIEAD